MSSGAITSYLATALQGGTLPLETLSLTELQGLCLGLQAQYLQASHALSFEQAAHTIPMMLWLTDATNNTVFFNKTWLAFTGRTLDQDLGAGWLELVHVNDVERVMHIWREHFATRTPLQMEYRLRRQDGVYRWMLDVGAPRYDEQGVFRGMIGFCVDITERKRTETRNQVLQDLTFALSQAVTMEQVANTFVIKVLPALNATSGLICLLNEAGDTLEIYNRDTVMPAVYEHYRFTSLAYPSPLTDAVRERHPIWLYQLHQHYAAYPQLEKIATESGTQMIAALPLLISDRVLGGISLSFKQAGAFSPEDEPFLMTLAQHCALAIERSRLYDAQQAARIQAELAQKRVQFLSHASGALSQSLDYEVTLDQVVRLAVPDLADWCHVDVLREDGTVQRRSVRHIDPAKEPLLYELNRYHPVDLQAETGGGKVIRTGESVFVPAVPVGFIENYALNDAHLALLRHFETHSIMIVPLTTRNITFGAITFAASTPGRFTLDDLAMAEELGRRAAIALENAQLYQHEQEARSAAELAQERLRVVSQVSRVLGETIDYEVTIERIARLLVPTLADWCGLYAVMPDESIQRLAFYHQNPSRLAQLMTWEKQYPQEYRTLPGLRDVIKTGEPVLFDEFPDSLLRSLTPNDAAFEQLRAFGFSSAALIPLTLYGRVMGVLLGIMEGGRRYDPVRDVPLLQEIAHRAVIAIDKARLYRDMQTERERLRVTLASIADAVIATDIVGTVLFMNQTAQTLTGWTEVVASGRDIRFLIHLLDDEGNDLPENPLNQTILLGQSVMLTSDLILRTGDGRIVPVNYSGSPIRNEDGHVIGSIFVLRDMTERNRLEEAEQEQRILEERQHLARELHDAVTQTLFASSVIAEALPRLAQVNPDKVMSQLERLRRLNRGALAEMRTLLLELRHVDLLVIEIEDLLEQLTLAVTAHMDLEIVLDVQAKHPLTAQEQTTIYRITQEALNNIVKHSRASRVDIRLHTYPQGFEFSIKDNGVGFDPENVKDKHLGLKIMRERLAAIQATLQINTVKGAGTELLITRGQDARQSS